VSYIDKKKTYSNILTKQYIIHTYKWTELKELYELLKKSEKAIKLEKTDDKIKMTINIYSSINCGRQKIIHKQKIELELNELYVSYMEKLPCVLITEICDKLIKKEVDKISVTSKTMETKILKYKSKKYFLNNYNYGNKNSDTYKRFENVVIDKVKKLEYIDCSPIKRLKMRRPTNYYEIIRKLLNLEEIIFGNKFNEEIDELINITPKLTSMVMGDKFNQKIDKVVNSLEITNMELGNGFNQERYNIKNVFYEIGASCTKKCNINYIDL
jgi:hypothetical protein